MLSTLNRTIPGSTKLKYSVNIKMNHRKTIALDYKLFWTTSSTSKEILSLVM